MWNLLKLVALVFGVGVVGAAVVVVVSIALDALRDWMNQNQKLDSKYAEFIKEKLSSGKVRVIGGVFDEEGTRTAEQTWEAENLSDDLKKAFANKEKIRIDY